MKNISYLFLLLTLTLSYSCVEGPLGDNTYTTIINNSGHNIELQEFYNGAYRTSNFIENNQSKEFKSVSGEPGGPTGPHIQPLINSDSFRIIYFEKASIWHTTDVNSPVSRSLMLDSSYVGGKVRDGLYEFTYTFTPEDFEEALEFGD
ncbi:MAG: hypothetical protein L3J29_03170 [Cyclobacteriaceae bacterium]|nr:hypothetical protein [Cyclobacteriaceae bacterium]